MGLIHPNANVTRAEVATIFFRLITDEARTAYWKQENPFSDVAIQNWFNNAISTVSNTGVFSGLPDGSFAPNQTITRAEMTAVMVINHASGCLIERAEDLLPDVRIWPDNSNINAWYYFYKIHSTIFCFSTIKRLNP